MGRTAVRVLSAPAYAVIATAVGLVALTAFASALHATTVALLLSGTIPNDVAERIIVRLYPFIGTSYGLPGDVLLTTVAVAFGVAAATVLARARGSRRLPDEGNGSASRWALVAFVVACAACVVTVLAGVWAVSVFGDPLLRLPFAGLELPGLALPALVLSIHWVTVRSRGGAAGESRAGPPDV
jgi:hypothetical protein